MGRLAKDHFVASLQYAKRVLQDVFPATYPYSPFDSLASKIRARFGRHADILVSNTAVTLAGQGLSDAP
ncbi:hypothetical protein CCMA1212_009815 [Trichoderma ghanense]|uniref:Uncharacterized protein n=1 Tax=Trichoderma ghanense TaxID=65468 RepID=A0ABY2GR77_9HYPO